MPFSVLKDEEIKDLLNSLTVDELEEFYTSLKETLHDYSNGIQSPETSEVYQPHRQSVHSSKTGATTLFMPSSGPAGFGVKVITLSPPRTEHDEALGRPKIKPTGGITIFSKTGEPIGLLHASTLTAFRTALASALLVARRNKVHNVTVFGSGDQAYWHIRLTLMLRGSTIRHVNIINRRFSDSCREILRRLYDIPTAVKEREGWQETEFGVLTPGYGEFQRLLRRQVQGADVIFCCTPSTEPLFDHTILTSSEGRRKGRLIVAIGSYMPDMVEIPVELLQQAVKRHEPGHIHYHKHAIEGGVVVVDTLDGAMKEAGEILQGGLNPSQLIELGELVMLHRIRMDEETGSDTGSLKSAEADNAPSGKFEKLEIRSDASGSTENLDGGSRPGSRPGSSHRSSSRPASPSPRSGGGGLSLPLFHRRKSSYSGSDSASREKKKKEREDHMAKWLQAGNVIYKSVGLGLMDLAVGIKVVEFARRKGVGMHVEDF
ncbi:hypothetical protein VPNG_06693 [Cytospora leucostoma]|uniref:Ornithine cyclodeaminase n=1 Tax=Cytospora leucostoma TaxID=1230097 RepID=A0A423WT70_9PEZI|nr:hypothetical protein VPNG_06693 [Cytospora leucostoma]